ncbi:MAG: hypothetical protein U0359_12140 [Byssovorax sp.]
MAFFVLVMKASIDAQAGDTAAAARRRASSAVGAAFGAGTLGAWLQSQISKTPLHPSVDGIEMLFDSLSGSVLFVRVTAAFLVGFLLTNLVLGMMRWQGRTGLRYVAAVATALLFGLCTIGAVRSVTRPSVERYLADQISTSKAPTPPSGCVRVVAAMEHPIEVRREMDDLVVLSRCGTYASCGIGVFAREAAPIGVEPVDLPFTVASCSAFEATRLSPDLLLVRAAWQESRFRDATIVRDALFRRRGNQWAISDGEDLVAGKASPPRSWIAYSLIGLALSLACWWRRAQVLRRLRDSVNVERTAPSSLDGDPGIEADAKSVVRWEAWVLAIACLAAAPLGAAGAAGLLL